MIKKKICIVDYGFGNVTSLENSLHYLKFDYSTLKAPKNLNNFSHLFLPGVGAFEAGMNKLKKLKWDIEIKNFVRNGGYLFGICLGMQLLFKYGTNEKTNQTVEGLMRLNIIRAKYGMELIALHTFILYIHTGLVLLIN